MNFTVRHNIVFCGPPYYETHEWQFDNEAAAQAHYDLIKDDLGIDSGVQLICENKVLQSYTREEE